MTTTEDRPAERRIVAVVAQLCILSWSLLPQTVSAQESAKAPPVADFIRVLHQWPWRAEKPKAGRYVLQASVRTLRNADSGVELVLLSMFHLARREAYASREAYLQDADVVIEESEENIDPSESELRQLSEKYPDMVWMTRDRRARAKVLNVLTQSEWRRTLALKNTVCLNMPEEESFEWAAKQGLFLVSDDRKRWIEGIEAMDLDEIRPEELGIIREQLLKEYFGQVMDYTDPDNPVPILGTDKYPGNVRLVEGLGELLESGAYKRISVIYGGGHFVFLWPYLQSKGFRETACQWIDILYLDEASPAANEEVPRSERPKSSPKKDD